MLALRMGYGDAGSAQTNRVTVEPLYTCGNSCVLFQGKRLYITNNLNKQTLPPRFIAAVRPRNAYELEGVLVKE